jgi:hypothetical protein
MFHLHAYQENRAAGDTQWQRGSVYLPLGYCETADWQS